MIAILPLAFALICPSPASTATLQQRYATIQRAIDTTMDAAALVRLNADLLKVEIELDQAEARQMVEEENRWFAGEGSSQSGHEHLPSHRGERRTFQ